MNEQNKEKLIAHLEKGTEIFLVLNDDTGIIGVVERNVLCWEETDENWHELTVYVGGQHITINSNNVKEVRKCIPHTEDEHNQIIGRDAFEIYNVPYGLSDVDFLKTVLDSSDLSAADSTQYLTSAMNGYKVAAEDVMSIVDKVSQVDLYSATSTNNKCTIFFFINLIFRTTLEHRILIMQ